MCCIFIIIIIIVIYIHIHSSEESIIDSKYLSASSVPHREETIRKVYVKSVRCSNMTGSDEEQVPDPNE